MKKTFDGFLKAKRDVFQRVISGMLSAFWSRRNFARQTGIPRASCLSAYVAAGLDRPGRDIFLAAGKKLRPILGTLLLEAFGNRNPSRYNAYLALPEILHTSSLVLDDIEDNATLRRNRPCLHVARGIDTAVNVGNALYFLPFQFVRETRLPLETKLRLYAILTESMNRIHAGQGLDILWHRDPGLAVSPAQYLLMTRLKTSSFFRAEAQLAVLFSGKKGALEKQGLALAENIGAAFQIMDDVLDVTLPEADASRFGKKLGQDIFEGKITLIAVHAFQRAQVPEKRKLLDIFRSHAGGPDAVRDALRIFQKYGCIQDAEKTARRLVRRSWEKFAALLRPSQVKDYLERYCAFVVERKF